MYVMEGKYGIDIEELLQKHLEKLLHKGYLTIE